MHLKAPPVKFDSHSVKFGGRAIESFGDVVSSNLVSFAVERLSDVSDEVGFEGGSQDVISSVRRSFEWGQWLLWKGELTQELKRNILLGDWIHGEGCSKNLSATLPVFTMVQYGRLTREPGIGNP